MSREWPEWIRFTLTAAAGVLATLITVTMWFSDLRNVAAAAAADNVKQDRQLDALQAIARETSLALVKTTTILEQTLPAQTRAIEALEARLQMLESGRR